MLSILKAFTVVMGLFFLALLLTARYIVGVFISSYIWNIEFESRNM